MAFLCMLAVTSLPAQRSDETGFPYIRNFTPKEYGADVQNWDIIQDDRGVMYFGNNLGLLEYDGANWRLIQLPNKSVVRSLAKDANGRIYVGGVGQMGYLDADDRGNLTYVSLLPFLPAEQQDFADVWEAFVTASGIYFSTSGRLYFWNPQDKKFRTWEAATSFHVSAAVGEDFYIRQWEIGLMKMVGDSLALVPGGERFADERIYSILPFPGKPGAILIGTRTQGLFLFDGRSFTPFRTEIDDFLKNNLIYKPGLVFSDGRILLQTLTAGAVIIDRAGRLLRKIDQAAGLQNSSVLYAYEDRAGALWLALDIGVTRVEPGSAYTVFDSRNNLTSTPSKIIRHRGRLYLATTVGVFYLDPASGTFRLIPATANQSSGFIIVSGELLVSNADGVFRIEGTQAEAIVPSVSKNFEAWDFTRSALDSNRIFVGLYDGLASIRRQGGRWINEGRMPGIEDEVRRVAEEADGSLWLGTTNGAVRVTFPKSGAGGPDYRKPQITRFGKAEGLPPGSIGVFRIKGETYFVTGTQGVFTFREESRTFVPEPAFNVVSSLGSPDAYTFQTDRQGRVWMCFGKEMAAGTEQPDGSYRWEKAPFLRFSDDLIQAVYPEDDGIVWFGGPMGLVRYDSRQKEGMLTDYRALIRRVSTVNEVDTLFGGTGSVPGKTRFSAGQRSLRFEFAAPSYEDPTRNRYQTWLESFEAGWTAWSPEHVKEYTNLPPGTYRFHVRAKNAFDVESAEAIYTFTIQAPWYAGTWAYLLYALAIAGLIYAIVRWRTHQLKAQREKLERTVEERTNELRQRVEELAVINSVQQGLVAEMDMEAIYELVGNKIRDIFDSQAVIIGTFDHDLGLEYFRFAIEKGEKLTVAPRPFEGVRRHLIRTRETVLINEDFAHAAETYGMKVLPGTETPKSLLFVPMVVGDSVRGYISLQHLDRENAFTQADVNLLTTLANSMSVALENARLFDETNRLLAESQQRAAELTTVNSVSQALAAQLELDTLIQMVGDQMRDLFHANIVYLALLDRQTDTINFPYGHGDDFPPIPLGAGLTSKIIQTGEPMLINEDVSRSYTQLGIEEIGKQAASYLGVPIPAGREIIGVLSVQSTEVSNRFGESDRRLLGTIAAHVGTAIHNARLFEQTLQARAEAEESRRIAEEANEAKSSFLSTVSHELRTPLTSVIGFTKIIRKRLDEKIFPLIRTDDSRLQRTIDQVSDNLNVVISEGERLTNLINEVLDLAKIESGQVDWRNEPLTIEEVIERATAATASLFTQKNLALRQELEPDLPVITGDRDRLIQVLINLLSNAVKFTDQGSVTVRARRQAAELVVSVIDTGIGIAAKDQPRVFEKFKQVGDTLTDKPKGTGLGLPICKEIVEHHGGRLWLESEPGKGSSFSFSLPLNPASGTTHSLEALVRQLKEEVFRTAPTSGSGPATILVVDDEAPIRDLLRQELSESGYRVREAANGREALEAIRGERPDLVILDVMMPEMNGFDVAAVLKNDPKTMDIPLLILSIVQDKERGYRLGVDRYLTKPIDTEVLFREVGVLLEQGKSKKKVMIVDENSSTVRTLADVLEARGYHVVEANGPELIEKALADRPDIIILNSLLAENQEAVRTLRFEKGLEDVLFLVYR